MIPDDFILDVYGCENRALVDAAVKFDRYVPSLTRTGILKPADAIKSLRCVIAQPDHPR